MAIPSWTYPSNTNLGTYSERTQISIPILVFDVEDYSTIETKQFENAVDSTTLPNYADDSFFWVKSNGLAQTPWLGQPTQVNKYSPIAQSYVFQMPRDQKTINGESTSVTSRRQTNTSTTGFFGVAIDGVPFKSSNSNIIATIGGKNYTENAAIYPIQSYQDDSSSPPGYFGDGSGVILSDKKFFYHTDPKLIYVKDPTKHSPIIGYAFDGNPIYGPYGFVDAFPEDPSNTNEPVDIMRTSYKLSDAQRINGTIPDGSFIEDFEYVDGLGDLDQHNGRFCKTPEYPGGTYAYFVTVDPYDITLPRYPYIIGPTYFQEPLIPNGNKSFPGDIELKVIAGQIPPGLRISGLNIVGTPFEVSSTKTFKFVLRATNVDGLSDRTYSITVEGADAPVWVTPEGDLQVGAIGSRTEQFTRTLLDPGNIGDTVIRLSSVNKLQKNGVISSKNYPNSFITDTKIVSLDPVSRSVVLSNPIELPIPQGDRITISYTYEHTNLFVLDGDYVNYQLSAIDNDLATGQQLTYYIPPRGGELPPGLTLSASGVISGFTDPILSNDLESINGNYDMHLYDKYAYDYGVRPYNGYDSFLFDNTIFDFSDLVRNPRKLNRYYQFVVRVTDGIYFTDRRFRIFVVGDDSFRADTTIIEVGNGMYTADVTPIRKPFWITPSYLGRRRANNYITTFLDVYDVSTLRGEIGYVLDPVNLDGTLSQLPPGMILDQINGEIYGDVPYQPAVTKTYKFTVRAIRYDPDNPTYGYARKTVGLNTVGQQTIKLDSVLNLRLDSLVTGPQAGGYITPGTIITAIDAGTKTVSLNTPLLKTIPEGETFRFSFVVSSAKTFTIDIIGEVDSTIRFITSGDLGEIAANFVSNLAVEAVTTVPNAILTYTLIGGRLPPGLTLVSDGTIQGKVNQFATEDAPGLTTFDNNNTYFDNFDTTVDREYTFIVLAQDQFQYSAVTKIFTISVTTPNKLLYSNVFVKPFLKNSKRLELTDFFSNPDIFENNLIYRKSDPQFGVQTELKMLFYAGIETRDAPEYAAALGRTSKKRFRFGRIKKAIAKTPGTNDIIYEVVYIEILDNMENEKGSIPKSIDNRLSNYPVTVNQGKRDLWDSDITDNNIDKSSRDELGRIWKQDKIMTADYGDQLVSDSRKSTVFGNSTTNIRNKIKEIGETERNFLPLWMRTAQTFSGVEQGFTKGVVLCYCIPGSADRIINNIKNLGIDFKTIDFTVDRVIIDSVKGEVGDKYIAFAAREIING